MSEFKSWKRSRGTSLIETAIVLPILLGVIVTTLDVSQILQAYTALREGVNASLRCSYTINGRCVEANPGAPGQAAYDVYRVNRGPDSFWVDQYDFQGRAHWLNLPTYQFPPPGIRATVLNQVKFEVPNLTHTAIKSYFPAEARAQYVVRKALLPQIKGTNSRDITLKYRNETGSDYPIHKSISMGDVDLTMPAQGHSGTTDTYEEISFSISRPKTDDTPDGTEITAENGPCKVSEQHNQRRPLAHPANFNKDCSANWPDSEPWKSNPPEDNEELANYTYIVLHAKGNKIGSTDGSSNTVGKVSIALKWGNGDSNHTRDLGGQSFSYEAGGNTDADFLPRGAPLGYVDESLHGYAEFTTHQHIKIVYDRVYTLAFELSRAADDNGVVGDGALEWHGENLNIYRPIYAARVGETYPCIGGVPRDESNCQSALPAGVVADVAITDLANPVRSDPPVQLACSPYPIDAVQALIQSGRTDTDNYVTSFAEVPGACPIVPEQINCAPIGQSASDQAPNYAPGLSPNYGVPQTPDSNGEIYASGQAASICPAQTALMQQHGVNARNVRWTVLEAQVPNSNLRWQMDNCSDNWPTETEIQTAGLRVYPHLSLTGTAVGNRLLDTPYYTGQSNNPADLKNTPDYSCANITLGSRLYDRPPGLNPEEMTEDEKDLYLPIPENSLLCGAHLKPGCDWANDVRQAAIEAGMNAAAYFETSSPQVSMPQVHMPEMPDVCIDAQPERQPGAYLGRELVAQGVMGSDPLPAACSGEDVSCQYELTGFTPGQAPTSHINIETAAQHFGFNELQAARPQARWCETGSTDPYCANIAIQQTGDGKAIVAQGEINVPLKLFFGRNVTLRHSAQRTREVEFVS